MPLDACKSLIAGDCPVEENEIVVYELVLEVNRNLYIFSFDNTVYILPFRVSCPVPNGHLSPLSEQL